MYRISEEYLMSLGLTIAGSVTGQELKLTQNELLHRKRLSQWANMDRLCIITVSQNLTVRWSTHLLEAFSPQQLDLQSYWSQQYANVPQNEQIDKLVRETERERELTVGFVHHEWSLSPKVLIKVGRCIKKRYKLVGSPWRNQVFCRLQE